MALPEILTKTTAGLPNWAWGLAIIGGIGVGVYFNRQASAAPATDTSTPPTDTGSNPPTDTNPGGPPGTSPPVRPPGKSHIPYTVQEGDSINSIASKLGIAPDHLWQDNRYDICVCVKHQDKIPCSYRRGLLSDAIAVAKLCKGMILYY